MQLDQMWINPQIQDLYANIIAVEDISEGNHVDNDLLKSTEINIGEIK